MIYRMHPDVDNYQLFQLDADVVEASMGENCLIYMDATPHQYLEGWKMIEIDFYDAITESPTTTKVLPDIMVDDDGKLFLSKQSYQKLRPLLASFGEALPVSYKGEQAYLFNVLSLAEAYEAIDHVNTVHDNNGLVKLALKESALSNVNICRTKEDDYLGIYCNEKLKRAIDSHQLKGCKFNTELVNRPA